MQALQELLANRVLISGLVGWGAAQVLKTIIYALMHRTLDLTRIFGDGGMPSCHSATVVALSVMTGWATGVGNPVFALACVFAVVVMHDAMGVRREAGKHAKVLNDLMLSLRQDTPPEDVLKEFLGHTPLQVCFGALLGFGVALLLG